MMVIGFREKRSMLAARVARRVWRAVHPACNASSKKFR